MATSFQETKEKLAQERLDFFGLEIEEAEQQIAAICGKKYHGKSVIRYVYKHGFTDFDLMLSISKAAREDLTNSLALDLLPVKRKLVSTDGTCKFLFEVQTSKGPQDIEAVYIPDEDRVTLCVSSQVGCKMGCEFCLTAQLGFKHHLNAAQIVRQVYTVNQDPELRNITNIVFMGMGEPLDNFDEVKKAARILTNQFGLDLSARKITVSTVGLVEKIDQIQKEDPFNLAVSLNGTTDELRSKLMPVNRRWKIDQLMRACWRYSRRTNKRVTFEYILMSGLTDRMEDADRLIKLLKPLNAKLNLIPYNESQFTEFKRPRPEQVQAFHARMLEAKIPVFTRKNRGNDIFAACGMLRKVNPNA